MNNSLGAEDKGVNVKNVGEGTSGFTPCCSSAMRMERVSLQNAIVRVAPQPHCTACKRGAAMPESKKSCKRFQTV